MPASIQASTFYDLASGRRRGLSAAAARALLALAELPYAAGVYCRNRGYDWRRLAAHSAGVPVVSVGNLTVGGTGKSPVVALLARWFSARGLRVAIVSRGYRAAPGEINDEAAELARLLPDVPHVQLADRLAAARNAVRLYGAQLLLLDDGFQHRRLARDLDLALVDATLPFGFGRLLPRGTLREPVSSLRRAQAVMITRSDLADEAARAAIRAEIRRHAPNAALVESVQRPARLVMAAGGEQSVAALRGARVMAFCGIGNPAAFRATLERLGAQIAAWREFPDHHRYAAKDLAELERQLSGAGAASLAVCTLKDLVKISASTIGRTPLAALVIEAVVTDGAAEFERLLAAQAEAALVGAAVR